MVRLEEAIVARIKTHGKTFELLVDPEKAVSYKSGESTPLGDVVAVESVFKDAGKGDRASEEDMQQVFETTNFEVIADRILRKGEIHLTAEQRKNMQKDRENQVVSAIAKNAINPQTGAPHPPTRIKKALSEAKVHIDYTKSAKEQVESSLKAIRPIIPIKLTSVDLAVKIPAAYTGKIYSALHEFGEVKNEQWREGDQYVLISIPGGLQDDFLSKISSLTHGEAEIKKR
ncbi:MAG: ribosome assembly factor SBDS [Candidatus Altiarchaeales archaeon]|nr:ribosome assembly factor SBDS [Candidatus Altiarchaeales archaeon]